MEAERQDGPTEYKLHLLLHPRRNFRSASTTTSSAGSGPQQGYLPLQGTETPTSFKSGASSMDRSHSQPSGQVRQNRLHQLTTQLLWRLQQSSPFHSSSNANLVLPLLPEATPNLGVYDRPAKLLPGLEESQGALYEIGVADDGTLIGLIDEELQESLINLAAMAASLGCVTRILRKVPVGSCEWFELDADAGDNRVVHDKLWVAEVLVYPDARMPEVLGLQVHDLGQSTNLDQSQHPSHIRERLSTKQIRITLLGATGSGKSSLLGTLSISRLDNGRGKSRLSLLKHRHEIASGVTSSVAQELIGYAEDGLDSTRVVNYASGNVSSWTDIHNLSQRLVFVSDSPGLSRFAKSTFRALISWRPAWTILCVAANDNETETSPSRNEFAIAGTTSLSRSTDVSNTVETTLMHLDLCLRLDLPLVIVITKMDLATKAGLRLVLAKILSALKSAGRKPVMISNTMGPNLNSEGGDVHRELQSVSRNDVDQVDSLMNSMAITGGQQCVPIVMTSAVTGSGVNKLHALLCSLESSNTVRLGDAFQADPKTRSPLFHIDEFFSIPPSKVYSADQDDRLDQQGIVLCGHVAHGVVSVGDTLALGPFPSDSGCSTLASAARHPIPKSSSYPTDGNIQAEFVRSTLPTAYSPIGNIRSASEIGRSSGTFLSVRVVSLRNLRMPVVRLQQDETGTVGVELMSHADQSENKQLRRARKGMVLLDPSWPKELPSIGAAKTEDLTGSYRSFSASFPSTEFSHSDSPPLILGGHALIYVNSIRAAVKVISVALNDDEDGGKGERKNSHRQDDQTTTASSESEVFSFDSDEEDMRGQRHADGSMNGENDARAWEDKDIKITFRFVSTVEWMELGNQVLVVPTVTAPGPVTGPAISNMSSLAGFVGKVSDCFT